MTRIEETRRARGPSTPAALGTQAWHGTPQQTDTYDASPAQDDWPSWELRMVEAAWRRGTQAGGVGNRARTWRQCWRRSTRT